MNKNTKQAQRALTFKGHPNNATRRPNTWRTHGHPANVPLDKRIDDPRVLDKCLDIQLGLAQP